MPGDPSFSGGAADSIIKSWRFRKTATGSSASSSSTSIYGDDLRNTTTRPPYQPFQSFQGSLLMTTCPRCGGMYTKPSACAAHAVKCNGTNRLMCTFCKRVYSQMCALKEHLRGKHGVGEMLSCKNCGRNFRYKPQLYDHNCSWSLNPDGWGDAVRDASPSSKTPLSPYHLPTIPTPVSYSSLNDKDIKYEPSQKSIKYEPSPKSIDRQIDTSTQAYVRD